MLGPAMISFNSQLSEGKLYMMWKWQFHSVKMYNDLVFLLDGAN
jgi:hypothetical protein